MVFETLEQRMNAGALTVKEKDLIAQNVSDKDFQERVKSGKLNSQDVQVLTNFARNNYSLPALAKGMNDSNYNGSIALPIIGGVALAASENEGTNRRKFLKMLGLVGVGAGLSKCKTSSTEVPTDVDYNFTFNVRNSMADGIHNTITKTAKGNSIAGLTFDELGVGNTDADSNYMVIRHAGFGAILGKTKTGSSTFTLPETGATLDVYVFPADENNETAYDKAGRFLSPGKDTTWKREQRSGVVDDDGTAVDINWGQKYWNHAFSELNRVLNDPYNVGSATSTGGKNVYEFRNEGGRGGRDNDGIWINPASSRSDISRGRTGIEELAEECVLFNNLNNKPSSNTLCDSNKDIINTSGHKILRLMYLMSE